VIAALFVQAGGTYFVRPDVDPWDEERNAMLYDGPHPVIAHPPCARWCQLAHLTESISRKRGGKILSVGDDGGTFAFALAAVRKWGGVLEHPAWSMAWAAHGLTAPASRGWHQDLDGGWSCEVAQSAYGHRATKLTWLYYVGREPPPPLDWSKPRGKGVVSGMRNNCGRPLAERVWQKEASKTPEMFALTLIALAEMSR
jgi:hypothetical protein